MVEFGVEVCARSRAVKVALEDASKLAKNYGLQHLNDDVANKYGVMETYHQRHHCTTNDGTDGGQTNDELVIESSIPVQLLESQYCQISSLILRNTNRRKCNLDRLNVQLSFECFSLIFWQRLQWAFPPVHLDGS